MDLQQEVDDLRSRLLQCRADRYALWHALQTTLHFAKPVLTDSLQHEVQTVLDNTPGKDM